MQTTIKLTILLLGFLNLIKAATTQSFTEGTKIRASSDFIPKRGF